MEGYNAETGNVSVTCVVPGDVWDRYTTKVRMEKRSI